METISTRGFMGLTSGALIILMAIVHSIIFLPSDFVSFSSSSMLVELLNRRAYAIIMMKCFLFSSCLFLHYAHFLAALCQFVSVVGRFWTLHLCNVQIIRLMSGIFVVRYQHLANLSPVSH